ncbi:MAG: COG1470 family protein [Candidatus Limnocylindrales bacterium]
MSDRVSGRPSRVSLTSRIALVLGVLAVVAGPAAPLVGAAESLTITTPYPEIVAEPGSTATFKLTLTASTPTGVTLKANGAPNGWANRFGGSGSVIGSVYVANDKPANAPDVQFSADVPSDATANEYPITLVATADNGQSATLVVKVKVESAAGGTISLAADYPQKKGDSGSTFSFNLTLKNDTPTEGTYSFDGTAPAGWKVAVEPSGQTQATSLIVAAGSSGTLSATVTPDPNATAGDYPVEVTVSGGGKTAKVDLVVTIIGSYSLTVSTPDQVLSTSANAGSEKDFTIVITNGGTAPVTNIVPTTTNLPTGWTVTFDPAKIDSLPGGTANNSANVVAKITPSKDAIAGDYAITFNANGTEASGKQDIRVRVETPQLWWIAGVVLLLATFAALYWVFRTYGRR